MFDFLVRKTVVKNAQKFIDKLEPKVLVHVPPDLPLPSIGYIKNKCVIVAKINGLESRMSQMSEQQLRTKTNEFKTKYLQATQKARDDLKNNEDLMRKAASYEERNEL